MINHNESTSILFNHLSFSNSDDYDNYESSESDFEYEKKNDSDKFVVNPFISNSSLFDVKYNSIVELSKTKERNIEMVVSHLFYTDENKQLPFF